MRSCNTCKWESEGKFCEVNTKAMLGKGEKCVDHDKWESTGNRKAKSLEE